MLDHMALYSQFWYWINTNAIKQIRDFAIH
jgi:hypothetical protein